MTKEQIELAKRRAWAETRTTGERLTDEEVLDWSSPSDNFNDGFDAGMAFAHTAVEQRKNIMPMNEEVLCTFDQSRLLKRLGFNMECYRYYINKRLSPKMIYRNHNETRITVSAPTVCDSAKFLREEHGVDLVVSPKFNSKTGDRIGYFWRWPQRTDVIDNKTYRTYEGALAAGISAVLEPFIEYYNETNIKQ